VRATLAATFCVVVLVLHFQFRPIRPEAAATDYALKVFCICLLLVAIYGLPFSFYLESTTAEGLVTSTLPSQALSSSLQFWVGVILPSAALVLLYTAPILLRRLKRPAHR
jgi:hypothetical protein